MSAAHWVYLLGLAVLIATVVAKENVIAPAIVATFLTGLAYEGSVTMGLGSVFNAAIAGTRELLPIVIIIALVTSMLGAMRELDADVFAEFCYAAASLSDWGCISSLSQANRARTSGPSMTPLTAYGYMNCTASCCSPGPSRYCAPSSGNASGSRWRSLEGSHR